MFLQILVKALRSQCIFMRNIKYLKKMESTKKNGLKMKTDESNLGCKISPQSEKTIT